MVGTQAEWNVRKRDGRMVPFDGSLIARAISNAFRAAVESRGDSTAGRCNTRRNRSYD